MRKQAKVMVVDDEEATRRLVLMILGGRGLCLIEAANGADALALAARERPDLMLLDVAMPGLDGIAVCAALKSNPQTSRIKVVMLTAMVTQADEDRAVAAGADQYITKPFSPMRLLSQVSALLERPAVPAKGRA
jgi:CheY-like chemotaxis protein